MSINNDIFNTGTNKTQIKESVTPYKLCVAILIRQFCLFRESNRYRTLPATMKPVYRRDFCILILKLIQSQDLTLTELRESLSSGKYNIDPKFMENFDLALRDLYVVGISYLLDLTEYISRLTVDMQVNGIWCQINKNSVLGCYLRRLMVFFDKLTFSDVAVVFEAFKEYYKPCEEDIKIKSGKFSFKSSKRNDTETPKMYNAQHITLYSNTDQWSRKQAELFIATQAALLVNNEESAQPPNELSEQIRNLLKSNPDLAEAHFLNYLNCLRVKEFCGAIDSLYHAFDKSTPVTGTKNNFDEKLKGFRYAALNLAALHIQFGHKDEALAALKECIIMAQEANDNICLQHALAWAYKVTNTNNEILIKHSILKSMELNLMYVASLGIQSYTQYAGLSGGNPKKIFETMTKSDVLNCQHTFRDQISNSYSQKSSLWLLYGKTEMSLLWSQLLLHLNADNLTLKGYNGESTCIVLCNIANNLLLEGEYQLSSAILTLARREFPNEPISHNWMLFECLFLFTKALHNDEWTTAETAVQQIAALDKWESILCLAELRMATGNHLSAQTCVNKVIDYCQNDPEAKLLIGLKIRAMILAAEIECANNEIVPANAITILNSALALCDLYHFDYLAALIHLYLANIQLRMEMPGQALKILDNCMVHVMAHAGLYDRARAMLLYAKCLVAHAGYNEDVDHYNTLLEATEMLKAVKQNFHKLEARMRVADVLFLQAHLYNEIGHFDDRNESALEYKQYTEEYSIRSTTKLITSL